MATSTTTAGTTMRAILQENYSEAENVPRLGQTGRPGDREVLLRTYAAGVDRGVWHLMAGLPCPMRLARYGIRAPKTPCQAGRLPGGSRRPPRPSRRCRRSRCCGWASRWTPRAWSCKSAAMTPPRRLGNDMMT